MMLVNDMKQRYANGLWQGRSTSCHALVRSLKAVSVAVLSMCAMCVQAQVYKCPDGKGRFTYSDSPCGGQVLDIPNNPSASANRGATSEAGSAADTQRQLENLRALDDKANDSKCSFVALLREGERGYQLAKAAKAECLNNEALRRQGRTAEIRKDAYNDWMDHKMLMKQNNTNCFPNGLGGYSCR